MISSLLLSIALGAGPNAAPEVELRSYARTPGSRIRLVDVITDASRSFLSEELLRTDLGRSPSAGFRRKLDVRAIRAAIPERELRLTGPSEVSVETDIISLDPERIVDAAREELLNAVPVDAATELELVRGPRELQVPRGRDGIELRARLSGSARSRGSVALSVEVRVDGRVASSVPISFLLRTYAWVPVLRDDVARGEALTEAHYEVRRIETTRMATLPLEDAGPVLGHVARRPLRAGETLASNQFELPLLVERMQPVTIRYQRGTLTVEAFGLAKEQGRLGEIVKVENLRTRKLVYGRVVGPGRIEMTR